jgi:divalent metal cation (Fe/Co/Zn/Cd) transporter
MRSTPSPSWSGVTLTAVALVVMTVLGIVKRRIETAVGSRALLADSVETLVCAYLSLTVLVGVTLNTWLHWWWADPVAGLLMVPIVLKEGFEAFEHP